MTLDEFNKYAEVHDYVIFTKQQYEHVIDVFNAYELLLFDYYGRLKVDRVAMLGNIRAEIKKWYWQADKQALAKDPCVVDAMIDLFIRTIDKYKADPVSQESEG